MGTLVFLFVQKLVLFEKSTGGVSKKKLFSAGFYGCLLLICQPFLSSFGLCFFVFGFLFTSSVIVSETKFLCSGYCFMLFFGFFGFITCFLLDF